jgi:disulfide bond formation protein DsbB
VAVALVAGLYATLRERGPAPPVAPPGAAEPPAPPTQPPAPPAAPPAAAPAATPPATLTAEDGKALYMRTCPACHGPNAKGMPGLGKDMTTSEFVRSKSDAELVEFIKQGRPIDDPLNTTGVPMPPMGANPTLTDAEILAIVRFIRSQSG